MPVTERSTSRARLFIVDDHPALREGLRLLLEHHGFTICGEAGDVASALTAILAASPELVMVDLSLGAESGLALLQALAARLPRVPLLVYSMHEDPFHVQQAFAAGASGYVTKREVSARLTLAVGELLAGRRYTSPGAQAVLAATPVEARRAEPLSPRELLIYSLLGQGYGTPAIAGRLGVSRRTVESYFARILTKLGLPGMEALRRHVAADRLDG
jgi:DNA-binding NarL/FixJ family response regulator